MRYGIFSDVHANLEALNAVLAAYQEESIDEYLCVGDVVGYGANPRECIEKVRALAAVTVAGNHDWASVNLFSVKYFNPLAKTAISWTGRNLDSKSRHFLGALALIYKNKELTLVHGTLDEPQDFNYMADDYAALETCALLKTDICFVGHTHTPGVFIKDKNGELYYQETNDISIKAGNKYIVNVGSVGQPRDGNPEAVYCIYDTGKRQVRIKRIKYDIQAASKKILAAGLPGFLGERLLLGR